MKIERNPNEGSRCLPNASQTFVFLKRSLPPRWEPSLKHNGLSTECTQFVGMLWRWTLGNESELIKFHLTRWRMSSPWWKPSFVEHMTIRTLYDPQRSVATHNYPKNFYDDNHWSRKKTTANPNNLQWSKKPTTTNNNPKQSTTTQ